MPNIVPFPSSGHAAHASNAALSSPPTLPIPRQPSPLSFSIRADDPPSPPTPASSVLGQGSDQSTASSSMLPSVPGTYTTPLSQAANVANSGSPSSAARADALVPSRPLPDSLLLRSTFSALEHSTSTLKRLSKGVLNAAAAVQALAEQVERAEDDLFLALGDLGRWLESGYNVHSASGGVQSIWGPEGGIRKVQKEKRRREREEMEVWVEHGLKAAKAELKRQGLAGGGAHAKFETSAKQFYHQTSVYLAPQQSSGVSGSASNAPSSVPTHGPQSSTISSSSASSSPQTASTAPSELAQSLRLAQFDLARYKHHSTLLYAIPPSSIGCLDLLVGLYSWVGGLLGETPGRQTILDTPDARQRAATTGHRSAGLDTPVQLLSRPSQASSPSVENLKTTLSSSLTQLAKSRSDLLHAWALRNSQTTKLEDEVNRRQAEIDGTWTDDPSSPRISEHAGGNTIMPISSSGIEHKKGKKMHKIHKSVGGRLREFLTPSTSTTNLAQQVAPGERVSRISMDGGNSRGELGAHPIPVRRKTWDDPNVTPTASGVDKLPTHHEAPSHPGSEAASIAPSKEILPSPRPPLPSRHSVQMPHGFDYVSPFIASTTLKGEYPLPMAPFESSPDLRLVAEQEKPRQSLDSIGIGKPSFGGVGGLNGTGDEVERREEAGRKKEGVLWGLGSWEGLSKGGSGKGKWEKFWVVLDHSRIYEYRDSGLGMPEHAHAVIDLKFASVREGRGTDRRFVFEIVTPSQGKRLYQATSDTEMKLWLYAICNAIESCINGTSSVRTFDASKLRTVSGSLDDHALPSRSKLGLGFNGRIIGLGLPMPPNGRRSMPPTPGMSHFEADEGRRTRKTSLKKVLKQSGERLSSVVGGGSSGGHRYSFGGGGLDVPRPPFGKAGSSRTSLPLSIHSTNSADSSRTSVSTPTPTAPQTVDAPPSTQSKTSASSDAWADGEIEKRVLEMAGLGLGLASTPHPGDSPGSAKRRVQSEAVKRHQSVMNSNAASGVSTEGSHDSGMTRSKSDDGALKDKLDMSELRKIADMPGNEKCADCGRGMRSSRWATISLRDMPMVMFICIRCCGIHRSLGTHISKPRSVDLDHWNPDMVALAWKWGNVRGNGMWEHERIDGERVGDEGMAEFIKMKYVEGRWLAQEDKASLGLSGVRAR